MTDITTLDKRAWAEAKGINPQSLGGMIGQMITQPNAYIDLRKKGFTDAQIPKWVKRPEPKAVAAPGVGPAPEAGAEPSRAVLPGPAPAAQPAIATLGQENAAASGSTQVDSARLDSARVDSTRVGQPALQSVDSLEEANRLLRAQGMRAEALGSDALHQWIREANIQEIGGVYYQRTLMPDGKSALIEMKPPREVLEAERMAMQSSQR